VDRTLIVSAIRFWRKAAANRLFAFPLIVRRHRVGAFQADPASASHRAKDRVRYLSPHPALGAAVAVHQAWSGSLVTLSGTNAAIIAKFLE
jgi:hypothetical protein